MEAGYPGRDRGAAGLAKAGTIRASEGGAVGERRLNLALFSSRLGRSVDGPMLGTPADSAGEGSPWRGEPLLQVGRFVGPTGVREG